MTGWLPGEAARIKDYHDSQRALVFDLRTGQSLGVLPPVGTRLSHRDKYTDPYFVAQTDLVVLTHWTGDPPKASLELWRVPFGTHPERCFLDREMSRRDDSDVSFSNNELAAWRSSRWFHFDVLDLKTGAFVLSDPPRARREEFRDREDYGGFRRRGPRLTPDGRTLVVSTGDRVFDVESGRELWSWTSAFSPYFDLGRNLVEEERSCSDYHVIQMWNKWVEDRIPSLKLTGEYYAVLELRTRDVRYYCNTRSYGDSSNGKWKVDCRQFYKLPPRVNSLLWITIQAVLAAPLLLCHFIGAINRRRTRARNRMEAEVRADRPRGA
jgi:hypothetical protein